MWSRFSDASSSPDPSSSSGSTSASDGSSESSPSQGPDASLSTDPSAPAGTFNPPRQERSRRTLERIVTAARDLVARRGVEAATVEEIVRQAETSVGSFYARFSGKEGLIRYLEERVWREALEGWTEAMAERSWEELSLRGVVEGVVGVLVRTFREDRALRRALGRRGGSRELGRREAAFHARVEEDVRSLLLARREEFHHPDPPRAASFAYRWAVGGIRETFGVGFLEEGARPGEEEAAAEVRSGEGSGPMEVREADFLSRELSRALRAYLAGGGDVGPERVEEDDDEVEFFDIWA